MVKEVPEEYDDGFDEPDLQDGYSIFQEDRFYILVGVFFGMLSAAIIIGFLILSYLVNK